MEHQQNGKLLRSPNRKRKADPEFSMDNLNRDVLEKVLSYLPTSSFFRLTTVSKRWKSAANSPTFKLACSAVPHRDPWLLMLSHHQQPTIIFDSSEQNWKKNPAKLPNSIPVASSGGLIYFLDSSKNFTISNPLTNTQTQIPPPDPTLRALPLHAIAITKPSNKLALILGEDPNSLSFTLYDPTTNLWENQRFLRRKKPPQTEDNNTVYFLSKAGNVVSVSPEMQRSPWKQYSAVAVGEERVCFVSSAGRVVECSLREGWWREYPRLLPALREYSLDVVECGGRVLVVLFSEFCESGSLRVWRFAEEWRQVAAMPAAMSHEWYGRRVDVNCVGVGEGKIMVCLSSGDGDGSACFVCDLERNEWVELPNCWIDGKVVDFVSAFAFQPRIEASV